MAERVEKSEKITFERLVNQIGYELAIFVFCAYNDVQYDPAIESKDWSDYLEQVKRNVMKGTSPLFSEGTTDIRKAIETEMNDEERWLNVWGVGDENNPYDEKDYQRLDSLYLTYSDRLMKSGGMDAQQEDIIRSCCRMRLIADRATAKADKENIDIASKLNKMIQDNLSSENLRKKDEKPIEAIKLDGIVDAMRKKYGVGVELTHEQAVEICSKWLIGHKYPMTRDAAEEMLLSIINCTRQNNDEPELGRLPQKFSFSQGNTEFADLPNTMEIAAYDYLGIEKKKKKKK